ncbi:tryptophanyl-tRNA synthetase [Deferribacter desulfuricans SSM1]|uniref:Tryptophan--tRNA ligase n=1 Tax=Deferribacter desulfuricans (strain DSM 14783 / JCM 11476 / NBRC 101012 / SSM1) TaxID=639282 RepID=D3PD00_DEFDS|nr:tryptophan--tRNA ligase [Deferribacter desulfuricans]BAI80473.1 tryptophanyl-tRNA synthetase [Deferribacter desulfuricans SSM1]
MEKVLSGMRPTGKLHIGHYFGALKNWVKLQEQYECFYFVADWHALTTSYENPEDINTFRKELILDWLSVGIDPEKSTLFVQSKNLYHAELFVLLSMITPVAWLERCPSYKEIKMEMKDRDLNNLGFLSYPLLQTVDIILYSAKYVPVGVDQIPHIEISREIVRRFHYLYDCEIFVEPEGLLTEVPKLLGTDGRKMSKSYGNTIMLSEDLKSVEKKVMTMITDTNRKRRSDPGNPDVCPVFDYHKVFSTEDEKQEIIFGCKNAKIGCVDCKKILLKHLFEFLTPIQEKRKEYEKIIGDIDDFIKDGQERANTIAGEIMEKVRRVMKI